MAVGTYEGLPALALVFSSVLLAWLRGELCTMAVLGARGNDGKAVGVDACGLGAAAEALPNALLPVGAAADVCDGDAALGGGGGCGSSSTAFAFFFGVPTGLTLSASLGGASSSLGEGG